MVIVRRRISYLVLFTRWNEIPNSKNQIIQSDIHANSLKPGHVEYFIVAIIIENNEL